MGGFARLTPRVLRPLGDARCAPHTPHWDQIERPSFRFAEGQIGGLGAEPKTQSFGLKAQKIVRVFGEPPS